MTPPPKHGPVLSITIDALPNVQPDDLGSLWTVFTKCKESLQDGARLENISWRLWYHELTAHNQYQPSSPILVSDSSSLPSALDSDESDYSSDSDTPLPDSSIIHNPTIENQTVIHSSSPTLPPTTLPPKSPLRRSSRSQARHDLSQHRRKRNSHPESTTTSTRPVLEGHRANSAPSHYRIRTKSHLNIGKIITSLLPETLDVLSAKSASLVPAPPALVTTPAVHSATPPVFSQLPPTLVVVQPTPRPTPPDTPSHSLDQRSSTSGSPSSTSTFLAVPGNFAPEPTLTPSQPITHQEMAQPENPQVGDRSARKKFFIRESPGGDAGASVSSSSTTTVKTEAAPPTLVQNAVNEVFSTAAAQVASKGSRVTKKGKESARRPAIPRHASGHGHAKHPVRLAATTHQRNHSTTSAAAALISTQKAAPQAAPAIKSKSTTNIAGLKSAGPSMTNLAAQMRPPPVPVQPPQRTASHASLASKKKVTLAPSKVETQSETAEAAKPATTKVSKTITTKNGQVEVTASSDFTDSEGEDDSSWSSTGEDDEEEEDEEDVKETGDLTKQAAQKAAEHLGLFAKAPPRSYSTLSQAKRPQPGLLTSLFHPNPAIIPFLPPNALRAHSSAQSLGLRSAPSSAPSPLTSKSAAAVPQAAQITVTQVAVNPSGRPGYRLKGKPEGEIEESSDDDDEEDAIPLSKSVAQKRLEVLAGKTRREPDNVVTEPQPEHVQMTSDATMAPLPVPLPHPYNLPAPAPVATPRTTRREMLQTEMSESLRRNILWERETNRRLLRGAVRPRFGMGMLSGLRPLTSTGSDNHQVSGGTRSGDEADRKPPVRMARNYSSDNFHAVGW